MTHSLRIDRDIEMRTRDGLVLRADVLRPEIREKVPAILIRTPYDKRTAFNSAVFPGLTAAAAGFAVVAQDVRGRFGSEGDWWPPLDFWATEGDDGWDAIEWVASQPWCDGSVGMCGASYLAECQYAVASRRPPHLKAIAPAMHTIGADALQTFPLMLESIVITYAAGMAVDILTRRMATGEATVEHLQVAMDVLSDPARAAAHLPVAEHPLFSLPGVRPYVDTVKIVGSTFSGPFGRGEGAFAVPALMTSGWYDSQLGGGAMFSLFRRHAATEAARRESRLIIGAWTHNYQLSFVGEWGLSALGSAEGAMIPQAHVDFFSRHLRGDESAAALPVVRYFVTGTNEWKTGEDWPLPATEYRRLHLRSEGRANGHKGNGRLAWEEPRAGEAPDSYEYDPAYPAPSVGGRVMYTGGSTLAGPYNQSRIEERPDVLVYTSDGVEQPFEVVGPVALHLCAASSAVDTDFVVKLCDVAPDDVSVNVADGILRAQWREGWAKSTPLDPGRQYEFQVDLGAMGHVFRPGHRIRVSITSSGFPHWDRNMNTGGASGTEATGIIARQTVFHDRRHPSYVLLPVRPA